MSEGYTSWIDSVITLVPDADREKVEDMFRKYEHEYYIPPADALRIVVSHLRTKWRCTNGCPYPDFIRTTTETLDEHGVSLGKDYTYRKIECVCGADVIKE